MAGMVKLVTRKRTFNTMLVQMASGFGKLIPCLPGLKRGYYALRSPYSDLGALAFRPEAYDASGRRQRIRFWMSHASSAD